ncbi:MAG: DJ-1/PfpI family protein [Erysipelotrichaceae bacterium]|nr:DJ-1/PfpI family protein [Erysipelotrichaceae bacterium]
MSEKRAAVLLADGFEEGESLFVIDILRRASIGCDSVSIDQEMVRGGHDIYVKADRIISKEIFDDYDLVVIPGGMPGAANLRDCELVIDWVKKFDEEKKYVAAICAGPMVLKQAGISAGRTLTSYPADKYRDMFADAQYIDDNAKMEQMVVTDGNLITSRGPATTFPFAYKLVEVLGGNADALKNGMLYNALIDSFR